MICSVCSVFVHGHFCNFIISNGNHQNAQCAFSFMDPQRSIKFPRLVRVFGLCSKRNFRPDFFQKVPFGLKMWKQTATQYTSVNCEVSSQIERELANFFFFFLINGLSHVCEHVIYWFWPHALCFMPLAFMTQFKYF